MSWADVVVPIASQFGLDPKTVWRRYSPRQLIVLYNHVARERWQQRAFEAAIHGADMGQEPKWELEQSKRDENSLMSEFNALRERRQNYGK